MARARASLCSARISIYIYTVLYDAAAFSSFRRFFFVSSCSVYLSHSCVLLDFFLSYVKPVYYRAEGWIYKEHSVEIFSGIFVRGENAFCFGIEN